MPKSVQDYDEYLVVTNWESEDDYHDWIYSDSFKEAHSGPPADFIVGHPRFQGYEVRLTSTPQEARTVA